jgi:hypothetical protein
MPVEDNNQLVHARSKPVADGVVLFLTVLPDLTPTLDASAVGTRWPSEQLAHRGASTSRRRRKHMHNQHAGLRQALAEQHMTDRREQASYALGPGIGPPIRWRPSRAPRWD